MYLLQRGTSTLIPRPAPSSRRHTSTSPCLQQLPLGHTQGIMIFSFPMTFFQVDSGCSLPVEVPCMLNKQQKFCSDSVNLHCEDVNCKSGKICVTLLMVLSLYICQWILYTYTLYISPVSIYSLYLLFLIYTLHLSGDSLYLLFLICTL